MQNNFSDKIFTGKVAYADTSVIDRIETIQNYADMLIRSEITKKPITLNGTLIASAKKDPSMATVRRIQKIQSDIGMACKRCIEDAEKLAKIGIQGDAALHEAMSGLIGTEKLNEKIGELQEDKQQLESETAKHLQAINDAAKQICSLVGAGNIVIDLSDPLQTAMDMSYEYQKMGKNLDQILEVAHKIGKNRVEKPLEHRKSIIDQVLKKKADEVVKETEQVKVPHLIGMPLKKQKDDIDIIVVNNLPQQVLANGSSKKNVLLRVMQESTGELSRKPVTMFEGGIKNGFTQMYMQKSEWETLTKDTIPIIDGKFKDETGSNHQPPSFRNILGTVRPILVECGYSLGANQDKSTVERIFENANKNYGCPYDSIRCYLNLVRNTNMRRHDPDLKKTDRVDRDMDIARELRYKEQTKGMQAQSLTQSDVRNIRDQGKR